MALIPWRNRTGRDLYNPFTEMETLQNEMNRLFNFSLGRWDDRAHGLMEGHWNPAVDIYDSKDDILVKADIPGMKKDELDVTIQGDMLVLKGEKKSENEVKEKGHIKTERFYGSFNRAIRLPSGVDASKVKASYKDGVLELVLPKKEESKPKQITVDVQ